MQDFLRRHWIVRQIGFEPTDKCLAEASDRIQQVLFDFKEGSQKGSQIERCLIFQKTIKEIKFSKEPLELVVSLTDARAGLAGKASLQRAQRSAARICVGEHESQNLAQSESLSGNLVEVTSDHQTSMSKLYLGYRLSVRHTLMDKSRFRTPEPRI